MNRRKFLKTTACGSAFFASGLNLLAKNNPFETVSCLQPEMEMPVIDEVDVLVVGATTAGLEAALSAVKNNAKVFVITNLPYLAEDVCANFRYWPDKDPNATNLFKKIFNKKNPPTPLHVKKTAEEALINKHIDFYVSSFVVDVLQSKTSEMPAGVVIANRSGFQVIKTKTIIDASSTANVSKLSGAEFSTFNPGNYSFQFTVLGNNLKTGNNIKGRIINPPAKANEKEYNAIEYTINCYFKDDSFQARAQAEQKARDLTWDTNQVDVSDEIFFIPPNSVKTKKVSKQAGFNPSVISLECFQPQHIDNVFLLNAYAGLSQKGKQELYKTSNYMKLGAKIGKLAALQASKMKDNKLNDLRTISNRQTNNEKIKNEVKWIRPDLVKQNYKSQLAGLPVLGEYDVVVIGGGTAGAPVGINSAKQGAKTLVVEYLHGLGGTGTLGYIGRYFHGYREGYTKIIDQAVLNMDKDHPRNTGKTWEWVRDWKIEWYRQQLYNSGGQVWFGAMGCGAFIENDTLKGVVVATPNGIGIIKAQSVVDSTGCGDIAIAAGSKFKTSDETTVAVQGAGLPPANPDHNYTNTDWTFIDDTDILDINRTFIIGKRKFTNAFDIGKLLQTRERRRIVGDFEVSVLDIYNNRTYPDTISLHKSSFDTHGFTISAFFNLKPPAGGHIDVWANVPLRSLLPKGLKNIIVTGLGASAHRDAMPVIRMQPCLQNQGYAVGLLAAKASKNRIDFREVNLKPVHEHLVEIGNLPERVLTDYDTFPPGNEKMKKAVQSVTNEFDGLEILLWNKEKALPLLLDNFENLNDKQKIYYALIFGTLGYKKGWKTLADKIESQKKWDKGWNYTGMGQFGTCMSKLDSMIIALGRTKQQEALPVITQKAKSLSKEHAFSHFRAVSIAFESMQNPKAAPVLAGLLNLPGIKGYAVTTIDEALIKLVVKGWTDTSTRNKSLRELILARALYRCGDYDDLGKHILQEYANDLRGHYARHAKGILKNGMNDS